VKKGKFSALTIISSMFMAAGALRIGMGAEAAIAFAPSMTFSDEDYFEAPVLRNAQDLKDLLKAFAVRDAELTSFEQRLDERAQELAALEDTLQHQERELHDRRLEAEKAEADLRATMAIADKTAEDDLTKLTKVYENMKPKEAANLFANMQPEFSAGFLGRMKPQNSAPIMGQLPTDVAYSISVLLAGRNVEAGIKAAQFDQGALVEE
jgi:flagellar motility protein MotE (MotC chaperone)